MGVSFVLAGVVFSVLKNKQLYCVFSTVAWLMHEPRLALGD